MKKRYLFGLFVVLTMRGVCIGNEDTNDPEATTYESSNALHASYPSW